MRDGHLLVHSIISSLSTSALRIIWTELNGALKPLSQFTRSQVIKSKNLELLKGHTQCFPQRYKQPNNVNSTESLAKLIFEHYDERMFGYLIAKDVLHLDSSLANEALLHDQRDIVVWLYLYFNIKCEPTIDLLLKLQLKPELRQLQRIIHFLYDFPEPGPEPTQSNYRYNLGIPGGTIHINRTSSASWSTLSDNGPVNWGPRYRYTNMESGTFDVPLPTYDEIFGSGTHSYSSDRQRRRTQNTTQQQQRQRRQQQQWQQQQRQQQQRVAQVLKNQYGTNTRGGR